MRSLMAVSRVTHRTLIKSLLVFGFVFLSSAVMAVGIGQKLDAANIQIEDRDAVKRGAKLFIDYCFNCHSAEFMRFSRIGEDLNMTDAEVSSQFITTGAKVGEPMKISMAPEDAARWFGSTPPDLSVISRSRGEDWLYTYLRSFYRDENRPWGVNNAVFKDVGMPHALWELQGLQEPIMESVISDGGTEYEIITGFTIIEEGQLNPQEYDEAVRDLVSFLVYLGEPSKLQRLAMGKWVLMFLALFLVLTYFLKREYWKDIH